MEDDPLLSGTAVNVKGMLGSREASAFWDGCSGLPHHFTKVAQEVLSI